MSDNPNPQEDLGYAFVNKIAATAHAIWRRLTEKDIGIDGLLEMRREDGASLYVGVQVKSGSSYFRNVQDGLLVLYNVHQLEYWSRLLIPVIVVVYNPEDGRSCWLPVKDYLLECPLALEWQRLYVPLEQEFNPDAFAVLRRDARAIMTPRLTPDEIKEFLEINRYMTLIGFVELARTALNGRVFRCRSGIQQIEFLLENGLVEQSDHPQHEPPLWRATVRGRRYVDFMLGDRYFIPFSLIQPQVPISDRDIELCMDFHGYIARAEAAMGEKVKSLNK